MSDEFNFTEYIESKIAKLPTTGTSAEHFEKIDFPYRRLRPAESQHLRRNTLFYHVHSNTIQMQMCETDEEPK